MAEIKIYGDIGWNVCAEDILIELGKIKKDENLDIRIDSRGGDVFEGFSILNAISRHQGVKTVYVDGLAASIASVIMCAGDRIIMVDNGFVMVHNPAMFFTGGEAEELRKDADLLDKIQESIILTYQKRTGQTEDEIRALLKEETWFNAKEAEEAGYVDEISEASQMVNCGDLSRFKNVPKELIISATYDHIVKKINLRKKGTKMDLLDKIKSRFPDIPENKVRHIYAIAINQDEGAPDTKEACEAKEGWEWDEAEGVCKKKESEPENQDEGAPDTKEACEAKEGWEWDEAEGVCKKKESEPENQDEGAPDTKEACEKKGWKWDAANEVCKKPAEPEPENRIPAIVKKLSADLKENTKQMTALIQDMVNTIWEHELSGYNFPESVVTDLKSLVKKQNFMEQGIFQKAKFQDAVRSKVKDYAGIMAIEPEGVNALGGEKTSDDFPGGAASYLKKIKARA